MTPSWNDPGDEMTVACETPVGSAAGDWDSASYTEDEADALAAVCLGCPASARCLEFALVLDVRTGMRGGLTPAERLTWFGDGPAPDRDPDVEQLARWLGGGQS